MIRWQHDVVDMTDPVKQNHYWSLLIISLFDGMGGGYTDIADTDTTETACLNISTEEPSSRHELRTIDAILLPS